MPGPENTQGDPMIVDFRAHAGQITEGRLAGASLLIMTTTGAKTGQPRPAMLGYDREGDCFVVVGSNFGRATQPTWLANIRKNAIVTIEVGTEKFRARTRITQGAERRRLLDARIAAVPIFGDYERKANRELPVVILERIE
jgi:deazaflavin-dependent oxidoreductase (nitroreductase family)